MAETCLPALAHLSLSARLLAFRSPLNPGPEKLIAATVLLCRFAHATP
ncbi:hypothetical protein FB99_15790 [Pantoea agglomerans]|nr:hypothetical protein FB99_15790 [Pantoea agglomerans]